MQGLKEDKKVLGHDCSTLRSRAPLMGQAKSLKLLTFIPVSCIIHRLSVRER